MHNLGMLYLARGNILEGRRVLAGTALLGFKPSATNLALVRDALSQFQIDVTVAPQDLPDSLREDNPFGIIHRDFEESVYESLCKKGVMRLVMSERDCSIFDFNDEELEILTSFAEEIEQAVSKSHDSVLVFVGRSPLLIGMMLKARQVIKTPFWTIPFSGMKCAARAGCEMDKFERSFAALVKSSLPKAKHYYLVDGYDTGATLRSFGHVLNECGVERAQLHALILDTKVESRTEVLVPDLPDFCDCRILTHLPSILHRMSAKNLFARMALIPGMPFFAQHWRDEEYCARALSYTLENDPKPFVRHMQRQMDDYSRVRGVMTRVLLADPQVPGETALGLGNLMAQIIIGPSF